MAALPLCLATLGEIGDGSARAMIDRQLDIAAGDVDDRGHEDGKPRKVTIEITMQMRKDGFVETSVACQAKLPPMAAPSVVTKPVRGNDMRTKLFFQQFAQDSPDQQTFRNLDTEGGEIPG